MLIFQGLQRFTHRTGSSAPPPPGISIRPPEGRPPGIKACQGLHRRNPTPPTSKGPCRGDERRAGEVFIYTGPGRETGGQRGPGRNPAAHLLLLVSLSAPGPGHQGPESYRRFFTYIRPPEGHEQAETIPKNLYTHPKNLYTHHRRISTLIPKNLYTHTEESLHSSGLEALKNKDFCSPQLTIII